MGDNHVLSPILPTHLESDKQDNLSPVCSCGAAGMRWHCPPEWDCPENQALRDTPVDFPSRLIQRADDLCYSLPMLAPDGSRCHVVVVGSFAAWSETMTALVREGFVALDEPSP